ncbi:MAG: thioesterase [Clostridiaceae bacterium]|nr:thioesterase [Clostridiaceae bacterium]
MITTDFPVRHSYLGANGVLRPSILLEWLQDTATADAERNMNLGRETLLTTCDALWIVSRTSLYVDRPITPGDYRIISWHAAARAALWPRGYIVTDVESKTVARAATHWTVLSASLPRRIVMLPPFPGDNSPYALPKIVRPRIPAPLSTSTRVVTLADLDENRHVNNARALDLLEDALAPGEAAYSRYLSEAHIHYAGEARLGDTLTLDVSRDAAYSYVVSRLGDATVHEAMLRYTNL